MKSRFNKNKLNKNNEISQTSNDMRTMNDNSEILDGTCEDNKSKIIKEEDVFNESLNLLSTENIPDNGYKSQKHRRFSVISAISIIVCVAICISATVMLGNNIYGKYKGEKLYNNVADKFEGINLNASENSDKKSSVSLLSKDRKPASTLTMEQIIAGSITGTGGTEESYDEELAKMRASLISLSQVNSDIYGWISIEGTSVNYPIVQGEDNDYYLDHAYTGDYLPIGSIFADFRCSDSIMENLNTVLYGHNITTGSMFNSVEYFFKDEYFSEKKIYLYTLDGVFIYEPFSIYETTYDSGYIQTDFQTGEEYVSFLKRIEESSQMDNKGYDVTPETRILTLSTCTNGAMTARYAFHAILVSSITD